MPAPPVTKRIKTLSVTRPIIYGNTAKKMGDNIPPNAPKDHTHLWTIFVRDPRGEDISYFIKKVVFKLHETYPNPVRVIEAPPFELTETGWGEFEINIKIYFADVSNEKMLNFYHHLRLHPYINPETKEIERSNDESEVPEDEVKAVYFDEIVFNEPVEQFFQLLMSKPGNLLPSNKTPTCVFSRQLEQEEVDRIHIGTKKIDEEIKIYEQKLKEAMNPNT
ncbi:Yaf9 [Kluyveromyces lactis]|nr:Yaf9 [Kluyveromyces lactis]